MTPLLEFCDVSFSYQSARETIPILSHISFKIEESSIVSIVGSKGCGKSTLLNLISGLLKPTSGNILIYGKPLGEYSLHIGYMLQSDHLFEWRTIFSNVLLGIEGNHEIHYSSKSPPSHPFQNMQQRASLIRALAMDPSFLLLDEPFSSLDSITRLNLSKDIKEIIHQESKTALLVTDDFFEALQISNRILVLSGFPAQLKADIYVDK